MANVGPQLLRRVAPALLTFAVFGSACGSEEAAEEVPCGNGVLDAGEECDGAVTDDCTDEGFGPGDLSCSATCELVTTACSPVDADGDGVDYLDEIEAGTNPDVADTDFDGVTDGDELANNSDPNNVFSYPANGFWPDASARIDLNTLQQTGRWTQTGLRPPNLTMRDQFGETMSLYQLYGNVVVFSVGAIWCPPCRQAAEVAEEEWNEDFREDGVIFIEVLVEGPRQGSGTPPTDEEIDEWVSEYGLSFPVVTADDAPRAESVPTFYILDRDLEVVEVLSGYRSGMLSLPVARALTTSDYDPRDSSSM